MEAREDAAEHVGVEHKVVRYDHPEESPLGRHNERHEDQVEGETVGALTAEDLDHGEND